MVLWATILVPSLLPFFIIAEIILNLGVVKALGVLFEPLMRPVFNLPGSASFVVVMGFTSGFPMGALLTRRLVEEKLCTVNEGERLIAFTNNSSLLFILAAIAVGIFSNPLLGIILAGAHYFSNILVGIILGLFSARPRQVNPKVGGLLLQSYKVFIETQRKRLSFGDLLGQAVKKGVNNIIMIGGFVIFFAVVVRLLKASTVLGLFSFMINTLISVFGLTVSLGPAFATGFWEMSLGIKELSNFSLDMTQIAVAASIILAWSGISIQSQVVSVLAGSGIKPRLYYLGRIIQCFISGLIAWLLTVTSNYWSIYVSVPVFSSTVLKAMSIGERFENSLRIIVESFTLIFTVFILCSLIFYFFFLLKKLFSNNF